MVKFDETQQLLVPRIKNHLSSFELGFLNIFRAKTCCVVYHSYCFCYRTANMARKNVRKATFDSTSEMIRLQPIRKQENNRKTFEGASVEPTIEIL